MNIFFKNNPRISYLLIFLGGILTLFAYPPFFIFPISIISYGLFLRFLLANDDIYKSIKMSSAFWGGFYIVHFYWFYLLSYHYIDTSNAFLGHNLRTLYIHTASLAFYLLSVLPSFTLSVTACVIAASACRKADVIWQPFILATAIFISEVLRGLPYEYGSPWALSGYTISHSHTLIQLADTPLMIYGLGFLVLLFCSCFISFRKQYMYLAVFIAITSFTFGYAKLQTVQSNQHAYRNITLRLVQTNTPLETSENIAAHRRKVADHIAFSNDPGTAKIDLVLWAESTLPAITSLNAPLLRHIRENIPAKTIAGGLIFDQKQNAYQNATMLIDPNNKTGISTKKILVPYAEYNPFDFIKGSREIFGQRPHFIRGAFSGLNINNLKIAPLNCYEMLFPKQIHNFAKQNDLITILANDAWFKKYAPHMIEYNSYIARMRAVENRKPVIRLANYGEAAIIDRSGAFKLKKHSDFPDVIDYKLDF